MLFFAKDLTVSNASLKERKVLSALTEDKDGMMLEELAAASL